MPIANYTTKINPSRTVGEIMGMLSKAGAKRTIIDFDDDNEPAAIQFTLMTHENPIFFFLPCNIDGVLKTLERDGAARQYKTRSHARCVAWRVVYDWVRAQLALVDAGQAQLAEAFLPYAVTKSGLTLWNSMNTDEFKLLAS